VENRPCFDDNLSFITNSAKENGWRYKSIVFKIQMPKSKCQMNVLNVSIIEYLPLSARGGSALGESFAIRHFKVIHSPY